MNIIIGFIYYISQEFKIEIPLNPWIDSFNLVKNWNILTDTTHKPKVISCVDGIRVLSIMLVMFGHAASNYSYAPVNNK